MKYSIRISCIALGLLLFASQRADAQENWNRYQIQAVRAEPEPVIDGLLDDPAWQRAELIDEFIQQEPNEGSPVSERTEVRMLYDDEYLYLAVYAYDSEPEGVVATEMRRDSDRILDEDNFQIAFDTFRDSRSAYMFVTNPLGAKLEQQVFEEGEGGRRGSGSSNINRDWDGVWNVKARRMPDGWAAEIAIPVVTLRFPPGSDQIWGVNFMRNIGRKNEQAYWAPITKGYSITRVSLAGTVQGMESLNRGYDLRIKPFVVTGGTSLSDDGGPAENSMEREVGVDLKYGITPGLNLDITLNTDFAQAEIDDEQVNLTRFPLFFPEKRDFFLENAGQFNVGSTASISRLADLFFSRRIGLSDTGAPVPIIGGARLTGKMGRNNIAVMDVQTDNAYGLPGENFLVSRYSRDVFARSKVGALVINKQVMDSDYYNRTYAADMTIAPHPSLTVNGFIAKTDTPGLDGNDVGGHVRAGWLSQSWRVYGEYTDLDDNFNAEVGFIPRVGIRTSKAHFEYNPRPGVLGIRMMEPMWNVTYTTDQSGKLVTRQYHNMLGTRFENGAYFMMWYNDFYEYLERPFAIRPGIVIPAGDYNFGDWRFSFSSNPARRFYYSASYGPQTFYDGDRLDTNARLGFRVSSRLATEAGFTRNDVNLPAGDFVANVGSMRVDFALSPEMNLRTLTQYNSLSDQWSTSARFHYIYRPGSDFYIVYTELNRDLATQQTYRDRRLLLKLTYLLSR